MLFLWIMLHKLYHAEKPVIFQPSAVLRFYSFQYIYILFISSNNCQYFTGLLQCVFLICSHTDEHTNQLQFCTNINNSCSSFLFRSPPYQWKSFPKYISRSRGVRSYMFYYCFEVLPSFSPLYCTSLYSH